MKVCNYYGRPTINRKEKQHHKQTQRHRKRVEREVEVYRVEGARPHPRSEQEEVATHPAVDLAVAVERGAVPPDSS